MGRSYRAVYFGTLPSGRAVREGGIIREEELEGRKPGLWMEEIAESVPPPSVPEPAPEVEVQSESAADEPQAESKRLLRGRKPKGD